MIRTQVSIVDGPVLPGTPSPAAGAGGLLIFEGFVREIEPREGQPAARVEALTYQTYEPMAQNQIARIGDELIEKHGLLGLSVIHSRGLVRVGECSIRVAISSRHRKEALAAMDEFIDRLKKDVPIWKEPVWASS
jgi:molybdopterin synthase catalytic subunit